MSLGLVQVGVANDSLLPRSVVWVQTPDIIKSGNILFINNHLHTFTSMIC